MAFGFLPSFCVQAAPYTKWETFVTVKNADTDDIITGAEVSHFNEEEFPEGHLTDEKGVLYCLIPDGDQVLTVQKSGYDVLEERVYIRKSHNNQIELYLLPTRQQAVMPNILSRDGKAVDNPRVTVERISAAATNAWNNGDKAIELNALAQTELPPGEFKITNSTYGTSAINEIYVTVTPDSIKYYADAAHITALRPDTMTIYVEETGDPMYRVSISREDETSTEYTANVTLENINATYGTFGLKYDTDLFDFDPATGFELDSRLKLKYTPETMYGGDWSDSNGYFTFVWQASGDNENEFKTEGTREHVATLKFTFKDPSRVTELMRDTFSVIPWHETQAAIKYEENKPGEEKFFSEYWRKCDEENEPGNLGRGRLAKNKAVINGVDTGGFYQAAVNEGIGSETPADFNDVRTIIIYSYDTNETAIIFHVYDADSGEDIEDAAVRLYQNTTTYIGMENTDPVGVATFERDIVENTAYTYTVVKDGYWGVPENGYIDQAPPVTTEMFGGTHVEVPLRKKIYHVPETANENVIVSGERFGYNGRDYHFRIRPAPGYVITKYPTKATVSVGDETNIHLDVNPATEQFTLPAEKLYQQALTPAEMEQLGYGSGLASPDENGYRSYNIIVDFEDYEVKEIDYEVTAETNAHGTVAYDPTTPFADGLPATKDEPHKKLIKTLKSTDPGGVNRKTGTFTFTADEGYKVEKVYINGLQIHTYDDMTEFTYTFGEVEADNDITVLFYDGRTPSEDTFMTLVIGEFGYAYITEPEEEDGITLTRRTYLNPDHDLVFTAEGMDGYELASVEVEKNNIITNEVIYPDDPTHYYRFEPPEKGSNKTVYVSFKNKLAEESPTLYVKSYVEAGKGVIDPCGIQICSYGDTPVFDMTAQTEGDWRVKGVKISPFNLEGGSEMDYPDRRTERVYTMEPLTENTAVGAIFAERGYLLRGYVDLGQGSNLTIAKPQSGAVVTFTRTDESGREVENSAVYRVPTTLSRDNAVFTVELPEGRWKVTTAKPGYVNYNITGYVFEPPENETDISTFGEKADGTVKKITPLIGSTRTGTSVTFIDLAAIMNTEREGISEAAKAAADVDDDGNVQIYDKIYALFNYGSRTTNETYAEFLESSVEKPN